MRGAVDADREPAHHGHARAGQEGAELAGVGQAVRCRGARADDRDPRGVRRRRVARPRRTAPRGGRDAVVDRVARGRRRSTRSCPAGSAPARSRRGRSRPRPPTVAGHVAVRAGPPARARLATLPARTAASAADGVASGSSMRRRRARSDAAGARRASRPRAVGGLVGGSPHVLSEPCRADDVVGGDVAASSRSASVRATRRTRAAPRPVNVCSSTTMRHVSAASSDELARTGRARRPGCARCAATECRAGGSAGARPRRATRARDDLATTRRSVARLGARRSAGGGRTGRAAAPRAGGRTGCAATSLQRHARGFAPARARVRARDSRKSAGNSRLWAWRLMRTTRSSSGWRSASSTAGGNSASSSRNSTPRCASVISPGRGRARCHRRRARRSTRCGAARGTAVASRSAAGWFATGRRVDAGDLERTRRVERGHDRREAAGEHRLADAGRPDESR